MNVSFGAWALALTTLGLSAAPLPANAQARTGAPIAPPKTVAPIAPTSPTQPTQPSPPPGQTGKVALAGSQLKILARSTVSGTLDSNQILHLTIALRPQDPAGLQAFADSVSDPTSVNFHKFATPAQLGQRYGASTANQNAVVSFLQSQGLKVTMVAASHLAVRAQGTVKQVAAAFGTTINQYKGPTVDGKSTETFRANATPLMLPSNLAGVVLAVGGVQNYVRPQPLARVSTLTPPLVRSLYNTSLLYDKGYQGQGRTIAISNFDGYDLGNGPLLIAKYGLPTPPKGAMSNVQVIPIGTPAGGTLTPSGEGDLDFQMVLSTAPLANVLIYDNGEDDSLAVVTQEQEDNKADIVSESWQWPYDADPTYFDARHNEHLLMTAQGMTYLEGSGDSGTFLSYFAYPHCDPEVLQVGGTTATVDDTTGRRISEVGWSDNAGAGGGGWVVNSASFNTLPSWQRGRGVPTNLNYRLTPDVALHAGGGGVGANWVGAYWIYYQGDLQSFSGTSASGPTFAASLALVEQRMLANQPTGSGRMGRIQNVVYSQNGRADVWYDVTSGSNGYLPNNTQAKAGVGWDFMAGWGAPDFDMLYRLLSASDSAFDVMPSQAWAYPKPNGAADIHSDIASDDTDYADIASTYTAGLGWTAGVEGVFNLQPGSGNSVYQLGVDFTGLAQPGATLQFYAYDWTKKQYVLITSKPSSVAASVDFGSSNAIAPYVSSTNQVDIIVRSLVPVHPGNGAFVFSVNKLNVVAHYLPAG